MLTPRIWVVYDENQHGWFYDVATDHISTRSDRANPYDTKTDVILAAAMTYARMGGTEKKYDFRIFSTTRDYVAAQIERDLKKKED